VDIKKFESELDVVAGTYVDQIDMLGGLSKIAFHFNVCREYEIDFDGDEVLARVEITAIMFGGWGSEVNIFAHLDDSQQKNYESEIEAEMNDEGREHYGACGLQDDDSAACTQHMDNMRFGV